MFIPTKKRKKNKLFKRSMKMVVIMDLVASQDLSVLYFELFSNILYNNIDIS